MNNDLAPFFVVAHHGLSFTVRESFFDWFGQCTAAAFDLNNVHHRALAIAYHAGYSDAVHNAAIERAES